jgi:hypothetical protein
MRLPKLLRDLIESDHNVSGIVNTAIANFTPWISNSQMPFFPEYTDHSLQHVEEVLQTEIDLVENEAQTMLSPVDAAALVMGTCLHDCAMHLTEDGFQSLVKQNSLWQPVAEFDNTEWSSLWDDFISEARRFDGRKLTSLFGDPEPAQRPPNDITHYTKRHRLLIGEFIRRHHARLAHEIALHGVPGTDGKAFVLIDRGSDLACWLSDISGLIARSHGIPLRRTFGFLKAKYHLRDFNRLHSIYLMTLLRIADYLQMQAKRAPTEVLEVRKLASPISQGEWKVHASVRNISSAGDDPEAIIIDTNPLDVGSFLRVRDWLSGIQDELDSSWAVLGEVYGRFTREHFDKLRLTLRRVRSNIDDVAAFARTVPYVPAKIAFETANPDLLKLLVGPLYGDNPGVGLRELIQNAVDAVRELDYLQETRTDLRSTRVISPPADVCVRIECDGDFTPHTIVVADRGIGMTAEIVQEYFLKAGASFRKSDVWKRSFEDDAGHSNVIRSGRFGIGALAAFLIGNRIWVSTRHAEAAEDRGITFQAGLDDSEVSLNWATLPTGTEIRVQVPPSVENMLGMRCEQHRRLTHLNICSSRTRLGNISVTNPRFLDRCLLKAVHSLS